MTRRRKLGKSDIESLGLKEYSLVALGGTFDRLHIGHEALIRKALTVGRRILIGLTTDRMTRTTKTHAVTGYEERRRTLVRFLTRLRARERVEIVPLDDPYGPTVVDPSIRAIVVSPETAPRVDEINRIRTKRHMKPLAIVTVSRVLAEDGKPISTTRMLQGEIDRWGRPLKSKPRE
jgi:pantetheine-phosphate adenylyltransferase